MASDETVFDMDTVKGHLMQHPSSTVLVDATPNIAPPEPEWSVDFRIVKKLVPHTFVVDGQTHADFGAFLPLGADDELRMAEPGVAADAVAAWNLAETRDGERWFGLEVSDIVLQAFAKYPHVRKTTREAPVEGTIERLADWLYTVKIPGRRRYPVVVGMMTDCRIAADDWQNGDISSNISQRRLSRQLRGLAVTYQCPQVFCFDGLTLLMLQFRASQPMRMFRSALEVDVWVLPRETSVTPYRFALYRLLVQGLRRCQGNTTPGKVVIGGREAVHRQFFNGTPAFLASMDKWFVDGRQPEDYDRSVDPATGALRWNHEFDPEYTVETPPLYKLH